MKIIKGILVNFRDFFLCKCYIISHILDSTEAILIRNIRTNENINQIKDLNYWFKLKEKGAITQEEYETKKNWLNGTLIF